MATVENKDWDPFVFRAGRQGVPSKACLKRIKQDLRELISSPLEGIVVWYV